MDIFWVTKIKMWKLFPRWWWIFRYNRLQEGGKKHKNLDGFLSCVTGGAKQSYRDFVANYSKLITHKATAVFTAFCLLGYWTSAIYGWTKLTTDLNTDKLFLKDSPVLRLRRIEKEYLEVGAGQVKLFYQIENGRFLV